MQLDSFIINRQMASFFRKKKASHFSSFGSCPYQASSSSRRLTIPCMLINVCYSKEFKCENSIILVVETILLPHDTFAHLNMKNNTKANIRAAFSLTHAGNDAMHRQAGQTMVYGLVHAPGIPPCDSPRWLLLPSDKGWVLFFGDVYIKAYVRGPHDVAGTRVQQNVGGVEPAHSNQTHSVPATTATRWGLHRGCGHHHIWAFSITAYFLWAWKEANVKLLPWYSPKNLLSSKRMWCTSLAEQRR